MKKYLFVFFVLTITIVFSQKKIAEKYNLMPWPKEITENGQKFSIREDFTIGVNNLNNRIYTNTTSFLRRLSGRTGVFIDKGFASKVSENEQTSLSINFKRTGKLELNEDESYILKITNEQINISAVTDIGAIRGLETLLQLISFDKKGFFFPGLVINDSPRFPWRGLMIDVARHFQPMDVIKRNLDAMASVKLNVFHWHLTDDQGFRVESKTYPKLHQLASDGQYYSHKQIKEIVKYASTKGIRVIPEFDVPGHASAILTAYPEIGSSDTISSIERYAGVFDPTLDPTNDKTYEFLDNLFKEITPLFPDDYFHIGGDENEGKHWNTNPKILAFKKTYNLKSNHELQTHFNIKLEKILKKYGKHLMGWDEIMTSNMPTTALIHSWRGENEGLSKGGTLIEAAKKGYKTVLSNGYYIDRMQSVVDHYLVEPIGNAKLTESERARILGGEATMWSELVTPLTIDSRIWPRTAAIAERFWSDKTVNDIDNMYKRLDVVSFRLEELGITHIKNQDVILRNIANNQDIYSLKTLVNICEPLKIYARNEGGTEYKSFSPFTLFADACTSDASGKLLFTKTIDDYIIIQSEENKNAILYYLNKWISNYEKFETLEKNPILNQITPTYTNLASISKAYRNLLNNTISRNEHEKVKVLLNQLRTPFVDVELVIHDDLKKLSDFLNIYKP